MNIASIIAFALKHIDILKVGVLSLLVAIVAASITYKYVSNHFEVVIMKMEKETADLKTKQAELTAAANKVTVQVVTEYVDRVKVVKEKGDTIVKEVPVYITTQADNQCTLTEGFASIHDAAAKNEVPVVPANPDAPLGVPLSDVTSTVVENYTTCHEIREQLISLQDWVKKQQDNVKEMNK